MRLIFLSGALLTSFTTHAIDDNPPNRGAFEGGPTGTREDTKLSNVIPTPENQIDNGEFNIPTGGHPSPLYGVEEWTMKLLRFEEFGSLDVVNAGMCTTVEDTLPMPADTKSYPDSAKLDEYLAKYLQPPPMEYSNQCNQENPWKTHIESYLNRNVDGKTKMEGRPPGNDWKHQAWDELPPQKYYQTATTGARTNTGLRYGYQHHDYHDKTEFGRWGLYGDQTLYDVEVKFHPDLPIQKPDSLWTFDGTFPPKVALSRYGETLMMRHHNALPVDVTSNAGFGVHVLTTHEHNGHNPAESDGYTNAFFFPGQYYDYRWSMCLAGHYSVNTDRSDPHAGYPDDNGKIRRIPGDWKETMSTHWMHDHTLDFTAANVYKGSAAMHNMYSALDRGNEIINDGINLKFPSGTHKAWGNRDYDINLMIADKAWDAEGQLWFNPHNTNGFLGDHVLTNWCYKPVFEVRPRRYRFRILNASVSRYFKIAIVPQNSKLRKYLPIHMIGNDGNIMEHAIPLDDGKLPTIGIAERYDIIIDFKYCKKGDVIYLVNLMQHKNGQGTDKVIPLEQVIDGSYSSKLYKDDGSGYNADPAVGKFMKIVVAPCKGNFCDDFSMDPQYYTPGKKTMIPIHKHSKEILDKATHRTFEFEKRVDGTPWAISTNGEAPVPMDPHRISAMITKSPTHMELWRLVNSGSWSHPIHIHFEEALILRKDGKEPPLWEKYARKDVFRLGTHGDPDSAITLDLAYKFRDFNATFMGHCHNTQHEDHAMLLRWDVQNPGRKLMLPSPIPTWEGCIYDDSDIIKTAQTGDATGVSGPKLQPVKTWLRGTKVGEFDLETEPIGDALHPTDDERGWMDIPLRKGTCQGRTVWFVLHDISNQELAEKMGVAYAGALSDTPQAALGLDATFIPGDTPKDEIWTFDGDLPNPVQRAGDSDTNDENNNYSPFRPVTMFGKNVIVNTFFVKWGDEPNEHLRIDTQCTFPDDPPNTACKYQGEIWGKNTGHVLSISEDADTPVARFKLHKSWSDNGDYIPYYVVVDSFPWQTAKAMGIIYVPKHKHLGLTAVPLVQFLPGKRLHPSYPPTPDDGHGLYGGGPLGGQIGLPSYFMPGENYSPAWHIGFAHWKYKTTEVVKSMDRVKQLRASGDVSIHEFPPPKINNPDGTVRDDYDFDSLKPVHVVNCPTPLTIDSVVHKARFHEDNPEFTWGDVFATSDGGVANERPPYGYGYGYGYPPQNQHPPYYDPWYGPPPPQQGPWQNPPWGGGGGYYHPPPPQQQQRAPYGWGQHGGGW